MDYTPNRLGQINLAGADDAMFVRVYAGEVLAAFREMNVFEQLHMVRTISQGKSATFPMLWKTDSTYHKPGQELTGSQKVAAAEREIYIDGVLISDVFIAQIDELKNHYDVRAEIAFQQAASLSNKFDKNVAQVLVLTAREADDAKITGKPGGKSVAVANIKTDSAVLLAEYFKAAQNFDEKDVPAEGRMSALKPAQYYLLAQNTTVLNKDYDGSGSLSKGKVLELAGITIVKSNNVPSTNIAAATEGVNSNNTYHGDFSKTAGICWHKSAAGTVKLQSLAVEKEYQIARQGTLMLAKYAVGHGKLRAEAAYEFIST